MEGEVTVRGREVRWPVGDLDIEGLRILIGQNSGLMWLSSMDVDGRRRSDSVGLRGSRHLSAVTMVGPAGFEPADAGVKVPCLTT